MRCMLFFLVCLATASCAPPDNPLSSDSDSKHAPVPDKGDALPTADQMEKLAKDDPIAFMEDCLRRYQREVKGYTCTFQKQERIGGVNQKLEDKEIIEVAFREKPFSVYFQWLQGARKAERALYVEGENGGKMLARPAGGIQRLAVGDVVERDFSHPDVKASSRYTLKEFGIYIGAQRTLESWKAAKANNALHVEYLGVVNLKEAGDRPCYKLRRTKFEKPEADGITEYTGYIDKETWLQVGSVLKGDEGKLIGEYYFRDIKLNPEFKEGQFTRAALVPK